MHGPSQMHCRDLQLLPAKESGQFQLGGCGMGSSPNLDLFDLFILDGPDVVHRQLLEDSILHPGMF